MTLTSFPSTFSSAITLLLIAPNTQDASSCTVYASSQDCFGFFSFASDPKKPIVFTSLEQSGTSPHCGCLSKNGCLIARDNTLTGYTPAGQHCSYTLPDSIRYVFEWNGDVLVHHCEGERHQLSVFNLESCCEEFSMEILRSSCVGRFTSSNGNAEGVSFVFVEWGLLFFMTEGHVVYLLREKDVHTRLNLLYERKLYEDALALGAVWGLNEKEMKSIHFMFGNELYAKKQVEEAMDESIFLLLFTCRYIATIGAVDASLVIRKYLDAASIHQLIRYLEELHRQGFALTDHTILLMNSYVKLHDNDKIQGFVYKESLGPHYDVNAVIDCLASSDYTREALYLAEHHHLHKKYIAIQLDVLGAYKEAIDFIERLPAKEVVEVLQECGKRLLDNAKDDATAMLIEVCSTTHSQPIDPETVLQCFIDSPRELKLFLQKCISENTRDPVIWNTYLELVLRRDLCEREEEYERDVMELLRNPNACYEDEQALILVEAHHFEEGLVFLYEKMGMHLILLRYLVSQGRREEAIALCEKEGDRDASLWSALLQFALESCGGDDLLPIVELVCARGKESLAEVVRVLCESGKVSNDVIGKLISGQLKKEEETRNEVSGRTAR